MNTIIKPTVGRVVLLFVANPQGISPAFVPYPGKPLCLPSDQPFAATICAVHGDHCINVAAVDANGVPFSLTSVTLIQPGDIPQGEAAWCEWMPYQVGQARKVEELIDKGRQELRDAPLDPTPLAKEGGESPAGVYVPPRPPAADRDVNVTVE